MQCNEPPNCRNIYGSQLLHMQHMYIRNRAYTSPLKNTLYYIWHKRKPDVSHLCEYRVPVWILLQGQHQQQKMLPKSKRCAFIGFNDGLKSVQYYNVETN